MNGEIYSVSQLNREAKFLLEQQFSQLWVEGEISNFSRPSSGHWYFSLKDMSAQVRCAMFVMRNRSIGFIPTDGTRVLIRAKVSLYEGRGDFQLIVEHLEETGFGALQRAFEALKAKLAAEGLFDPQYKQALPLFPRTIGIITSPTGAAVRDILTTLKRRCPSLQIIIYPTVVQGEQAAPQIVHALQQANTRAECDVLIVARGGGSLEDLWPFNEESVARAIFASKIPIVSGVGHEIDFSIADLVADQRAATPTAAAELVSPELTNMEITLSRFGQRLLWLMQHKLAQQQQLLSMLFKRLRHPRQALQEKAQRLDELEQRLKRNIQINLLHQQQSLRHAIHRLDIVNPLATLQRGYAIAIRARDKHIISSVNAVQNNEILKVKLSDGILDCEVLNIENLQ